VSSESGGECGGGSNYGCHFRVWDGVCYLWWGKVVAFFTVQRTRARSHSRYSISCGSHMLAGLFPLADMKYLYICASLCF